MASREEKAKTKDKEFTLNEVLKTAFYANLGADLIKAKTIGLKRDTARLAAETPKPVNAGTSAAEKASSFVMKAARAPAPGDQQQTQKRVPVVAEQGPKAKQATPEEAAVFSSTCTRAASYEEDSGELKIMFTSGKQYAYDDVPVRVWNEYLKAGSKGRFFNFVIRNPLGRYPYRREL